MDGITLGLIFGGAIIFILSIGVAYLIADGIYILRKKRR